MTAPIHVPRVWEVTGKAPEDRRRAVREWRETHARLKQPLTSQGKRRLTRETRSL